MTPIEGRLRRACYDRATALVLPRIAVGCGEAGQRERRRIGPLIRALPLATAEIDLDEG